MTIVPYIHASCVEKNGRGILIRGHSGAGKSAFALALMNHGFRLVADDQVRVAVEEGCLTAQPAEPLKGLIEVRGVGLLRMNHTPSCTLLYQVDLIPGYRYERLPASKRAKIQGVSLRSFQMNPMDPRSIEKILVLFHQDFLGFYEEDMAPASAQM